MAIASSPPIDLSGDPRRRRRERRVKRVFFAASVLSIFISAAIVISLVGQAAGFLSQIDLGQLWTDGWFPRRGRFDLRTIVWHTLLTSLIAMAVATPLGLGAAMYLSEYARPNVRRVLKPILEILAGIPSVVLGVLRPPVHHPEHRPAALRARCRDLQPPRRRNRGRDPHRPAHRLGLRRRHAGCPRRPPRGVVRSRRQAVAHRFPGGLPGRHLRGHRLPHPRHLPGGG